jgi:CubicO group peptidase (beta-lactamase class C family)
MVLMHKFIFNPHELFYIYATMRYDIYKPIQFFLFCFQMLFKMLRMNTMKKMLLLFCLVVSAGLQAQLSSAQIDEVVQQTMKAFNVPGVAVAIVHHDEVVFTKGYGVRSVLTNEKVNENTLFGIASNSKAFTATALAMLVDEGKVQWTDKVVQYIPEFKLYNDYVTQEFTIADLLCHRSGLGMGAGDLMLWPEKNTFTTQEIINNLHYLKPVSDFRTKYDYNNLMYVVAGEVIHRISGKSWEEFIEQQLLEPLQMKTAKANFTRLKDTSNVASPHVMVQGKLQTVERYTEQPFNAAAGIYASVSELTQWMQFQLHQGKLPSGLPLVSEKQHKTTWTSHTILSARSTGPYTTNFRSYGLGWLLIDVNGALQVSHTGGLEGMVTQVLLIPSHKLGIAVLTNQQSGAAFTAISNAIKDSYLGIPTFDHIGFYQQKQVEDRAEIDKVEKEVWDKVAQNSKLKRDASQLIGAYTDEWFGAITITQKKNKLYFASQRSPKIAGELLYYDKDTYVLKLNDREMEADAFLNFTHNNTQFTMKAISPITDFSYDYQDLSFVKQN